mmetsp:Transcript_8349/g.12451  ORF Transcript_8349/g.12451 Transcript_8349/m.12451 type:complete len:635 (-) Transcript_8349:293-2197(-)
MTSAAWNSLSKSNASFSSMSDISMPDLPNLPGIRRDLSAINPKLYKEFKASKSQIFSKIEEDSNSVTSFFDDPNRIMDLSKSLSHFPNQSGSFNDLTGRYSIRSQQQDRRNNHRSLPFSSLDGKKSFVNSNKLVCTFIAFFTENFEKTIGEQSRKVHIKFHLEDNTIEVVEPRVENSGSINGQFLKRHQVPKPKFLVSEGDLPYYTIEDFYSAGVEIEMYNRVFVIVDCDDATKNYFEERGMPFGAPLKLPNSVYDPTRRPGATRGSSRASTASATGGKSKGKPKVLGAFEFGRKVLRFYGVWDCRASLFGDELKVKLHYSLADGALEIVPVHERNGGRDRLPKYLKRTQVMKEREDFMNTTAASIDEYSLAGYSSSGLISSGSMLALLGEGPGIEPPQAYHWKDLTIGMRIPVASLDILLIDADEFTREFYNSKEIPLAPPIELPKPIYPDVSNEPIPPLIPKPIKTMEEKKKANIYMGVVLQFQAILDNPKEADKSRQFVIQYYMENDTVQIMEPQVRNSGHKGGVFLTRCKLENSLNPPDIYLGAVVSILAHKFVVLDADLYTLKFMENHTEIWRQCELSQIVKKIKTKKEVLQRVMLTYPGLTSVYLNLPLTQVCYDWSYNSYIMNGLKF